MWKAKKVLEGEPKLRIDLAASFYIFGIQVRITVWDMEYSLNLGKAFLKT